MVVEVFLATALICFDGMCHEALVGRNTLRGEYVLRTQATAKRGYGGNVMVYRETHNALYAVHRTWPGREHLYARADRVVTNGCINVPPEVYDRLLACCDGATLLVR